MQGSLIKQTKVNAKANTTTGEYKVEVSKSFRFGKVAANDGSALLAA